METIQKYFRAYTSLLGLDVHRHEILVLGSTGSTEGGTGQYMMVLGQYRSVLVDTLWYWVSIERYWLIYDGTGSEWVNTC